MLKKEKNRAFIKECKTRGVEPLHFSDGNKKLKGNARTSVFIWNLPAVVTCPFRTGLCSGECYAKKSERAYPDVLPARRRNFMDSRKKDFVERMTYTILKRRHYISEKKRLLVRIHESGDFYNAAYTRAWLEIINNCAGENIKFVAYTKSFPFFDGVKLPRALAFRASVWADTPPAALAMIKKNDWNIYTAVERFTDEDEFYHCLCEDCTGCGACWNDEIPLICCVIH